MQRTANFKNDILSTSNKSHSETKQAEYNPSQVNSQLQKAQQAAQKQLAEIQNTIKHTTPKENLDELLQIR